MMAAHDLLLGLLGGFTHVRGKRWYPQFIGLSQDAVHPRAREMMVGDETAIETRVVVHPRARERMDDGH